MKIHLYKKHHLKLSPDFEQAEQSKTEQTLPQLAAVKTVELPSIPEQVGPSEEDQNLSQLTVLADEFSHIPVVSLSDDLTWNDETDFTVNQTNGYPNKSTSYLEDFDSTVNQINCYPNKSTSYLDDFDFTAMPEQWQWTVPVFSLNTGTNTPQFNIIVNTYSSFDYLLELRVVEV
ncbi:hypothetical protein EX30DRAFT_342622 [Ascodesmis nigricans]|uniref:Uncharacterized protein n=1 Tax=Ascodesmis nigricans TaxID=341454 RepID=A0A4S2MPY9_9PEZI|nr:hypothetical protein EX30DRAFT_342622 [Ascodesmis nigricans]